MGEYIAVTNRLIVRPWQETDVCRLHQICADDRVMEFLGPIQCEAEVSAMIERQQALQSRLGYCFWALEHRETRLMIGFCGLKSGPVGTPLEDKTEIGWRLAYDHWGLGYAREAARASLEWGWRHLTDKAIWSITVPENNRSWGLMKRIGMTRHDDLDFDNPHVPPESPLRPHITYSIARPL